MGLLPFAQPYTLHMRGRRGNSHVDANLCAFERANYKGAREEKQHTQSGCDGTREDQHERGAGETRRSGAE